MQSAQSTDHIVTIDKKHDIVLGKDTNTGAFYLWFKLTNTSCDLPKLINLKLFNLIADLNKDVIEELHIANENAVNQANILYIFKQFGKDLGISQKCMYVNTSMETESNKVIITGTAIDPPEELAQRFGTISNSNSKMIFSWDNPHEITVSYMFQAHINDKLPKYMENIMGLLTKKMFIRMKNCIEKM